MPSINPVAKRVTLARLEAQSDQIKITFASGETFTKTELIQQVENETEIGKKLVDIQIGFLKDLAAGKIYQDD